MDLTSYQGVPQGRLEPKQLPNVRSLGKGLSGFIYETTWLGQGRYSRKDFPLRSLKRSRVFEEEAKVLLELDHPNLVRCLGYTLGKSSSSLLQEYVDDDLQNVVQRRTEAQRVKSTSHSRIVDDVEEIKSLLAGKDKGNTGLDDGRPRNTLQFEMREAEDIISQIAAGMKYLHDKKIAHGDLKPKNVLLFLDESGKTKGVKIADHGLQGTKKLIRLVSKRTRHFEILTWKAPELFEELLGPVTEDSDHPFTDSDIDSDEDVGRFDDFLESSLAMVDVYSFGLTCSYILGAKVLFPELSLTQLRAQRMHEFKRISLSLPPTCPKYLQSMIASCLQSDPVSRPTFSAICNTLKEDGGVWRSANANPHKSKGLAGLPTDGSASDLHRGEMKAGFTSHIYEGELDSGSASAQFLPTAPHSRDCEVKSLESEWRKRSRKNESASLGKKAIPDYGIRYYQSPSCSRMGPWKPRVVVGLDFGTTYSGFAFAHITDPEKVYTFYDYPKAGGAEKPYCKTVTGIYYKNVGPDNWEFKSWGYPARAEYAEDIQAMRKQRKSGGPSSDPSLSSLGAYLTRFKLHLASKDMGESSAQGLPSGLTVSVLITDYLREMGALILNTLRDNYGAHFGKEAIQWCVTLPSIWDNAAKAMMKTCMTAAGLVNRVDGSPHPLIMVLEPEAASFFCHKSMNEQVLRVGDKLLVADIGGGTSDIVVQEIVSVGKNSYRVKEVTTSSGGLCGGTYVDQRYMEYLHRTIGPCLQECITQQLNIYSQLIQAWEHKKTTFGDRSTIGESTDINLPNRVVTEWEKYDEKMGRPPRQSYDDLEISYQEMQAIFDPVIEQNMGLISRQLAQVKGVKLLVVVGGFAGSPYLMDCIRQRFSKTVPQIISPPNPGSAVCQGAVLLALNPDTVVSRVCKKTYGIEFSPSFDRRKDLKEYKMVVDGTSVCSNRFEIYVRKGEKVDVNACISRNFSPLHRGQRVITFQLFSSEATDPRYTVGKGVRKEGEIEIDISSDMRLDTQRQVKVSLFFGGSSVDIKAEAVNFSAGGSQKELPVELGFC